MTFVIVNLFYYLILILGISVSDILEVVSRPQLNTKKNVLQVVKVTTQLSSLSFNNTLVNTQLHIGDSEEESTGLKYMLFISKTSVSECPILSFQVSYNQL